MSKGTKNLKPAEIHKLIVDLEFAILSARPKNRRYLESRIRSLKYKLTVKV